MKNNKTQETRVGNVLAGWNHFGSMGPIQIRNASGAQVQLESGKWCDDYIMGWGSCFLGHDSELITNSITDALSKGYLQQYETAKHEQLSELFCAAVPCAEKLRLVNSGLEGTMYAIRIARAITGRRLIIKFEGHFHGLNDCLAWNVDCSITPGKKLEDGSLESIEGTPGIPIEVGNLTIPVDWNDFDAIQRVFNQYGTDIAGVILEPIALNIGCIKPYQGFLKMLRGITKKNKSLLIFDEVLTGFRGCIGGAQQHYNITPDLAVFGKAFGCGMPIAGIAGSTEIMDIISPRGQIQISGTNTGRYLSVSAAVAVLEHLEKGQTYSHIEDLETCLKNNLRKIFSNHNIPCHIDGYGGRIGVHIGTATAPQTMKDIKNSYPKKFADKLFQELTTKFNLYGFLLPLAYCPEPITLSAAHTLPMINRACEKLDEALAKIPYEQE